MTRREHGPTPRLFVSDYGRTLTQVRPGHDGPRPVSRTAAKTVWYMHRRGHRWVLASNVKPGSSDRRAGLAAAGIPECFDAVLTSDDIGYSKPDGRFYQAVLQVADCPPDQILFIDNRLVNARGALNHGMHAALIDTGGEAEMVPPEVPVLGSMPELPALLYHWTL